MNAPLFFHTGERKESVSGFIEMKRIFFLSLGTRWICRHEPFSLSLSLFSLPCKSAPAKREIEIKGNAFFFSSHSQNKISLNGNPDHLVSQSFHSSARARQQSTEKRGELYPLQSLFTSSWERKENHCSCEIGIQGFSLVTFLFFFFSNKKMKNKKWNFGDTCTVVNMVKVSWM